MEIWDVDGNRFLDFAADIAFCSTDHGHPTIVATVRRATESFLHIFSDYWREEQARIGEIVAKVAPFGEPAITLFCNSEADLK